MRIITGFYKGLNVKAPEGIRPTEDRVRKALFDILGDVSGLSMLELYAGSGAVGMEAASLGASRVVFVEQNRVCCRTIDENIRRISAKSGNNPETPLLEVLNDDAANAVHGLFRAKESFDIIFADPPFYKGLAEKILQCLGEYDILSNNSGLLVIQHFKKDPLPPKQGNLVLIKQNRYGDSVLSFYRYP